jgi:hypothetical protein
MKKGKKMAILSQKKSKHFGKKKKTTEKNLKNR